MVKIVDYVKRTNRDGKEFNALIPQSGIELVKSRETQRWYATAKRASITSTFNDSECQNLIGTEIPGSVQRVETEPYEFTVVLDLDIKHQANTSKDRTGLFTNPLPFAIAEQTGIKIRIWCEGEDLIKKVESQINDTKTVQELRNILANTQQISYADLKHKCIIPVFSKDILKGEKVSVDGVKLTVEVKEVFVIRGNPIISYISRLSFNSRVTLHFLAGCWETVPLDLK